MQEKSTQEAMEMRTFIFLLLLASLGFLWLLMPFFGPIFWACAIAIIFYPLQQRLLRRYPDRRNFCALMTLLACILVVVLPMMLVISSAINEGLTVYQKIEKGDITPTEYFQKIDGAFPVIENFLGGFGIEVTKLRENVTDAAMASGKFLARHTLSIGQNAFTFLLHLCLMLYLTFFMLRDGNKLIELLIRALPLGDARERLLFAKFAEVTRATVKGNMVIAIIQGSLGGLIFWILGIPVALLWGVAMAIVSLIPAVGPALIWLPVAIYLLATGQTADAIILVAFGAIVIGLIDNILRPILVGRDTKMPDYIVLLSTLGGLAIVGINGFVVGPLIAALFMAFWGIFIREINNQVHPGPDFPPPSKKIITSATAPDSNSA
jgi:predicted PurR-regulated permease PerM